MRFLARFKRVMALLLASAVVASTRAHAQAPDCLGGWGSRGYAIGQFVEPYDVAVDDSGLVYVADHGNNRVQVFGSDGAYRRQWGTWGTGNGQFKGPCALAFGPSGSLYVADYGNWRIQVFTPDGAFLQQFPTRWNGMANVYTAPQGVAVDAAGRTFVTDLFNGCVEVYAADGSFQQQWSPYVNEPGSLKEPVGLTVTPGGDVLVASHRNHGIVEFHHDGGFVRRWSCEWPTGVKVDRNGHVRVTSDYGFVSEFTADGTLVGTVGSSGTGPCQMAAPMGLSPDAQGRVYVADTNNHRILVFGAAPTPVTVTTWGRLKARYR